MKIRATLIFVRELKRLKKKRYDLFKFEKVINLIIREDTEILVRRVKDLLKGNWKGDRECHIEDDWLLSYKINRGKIQVN